MSSQLPPGPGADSVVPPGPAWLFCPGDRPDRFAKAADLADAVVIDLEDAVTPDRKAVAREHLGEALAAVGSDRLVVRVNAPGSPWLSGDLLAVGRLDVSWVLVPKVASAADLEGVAQELPSTTGLVALCETAAGVWAVGELAAHPRCSGLFWGSDDLTADLGGTSSRDRTGAWTDAVEHARWRVRLAAGAHGRPAVDSPTLRVDDLDRCAAEAAEAARGGFHAKACIHPRQVPVVRAAFTPTPQQVAWATRVLAAAADHGGDVPTAFRLDGEMVDAPVVRQARAVVDRRPQES